MNKIYDEINALLESLSKQQEDSIKSLENE